MATFTHTLQGSTPTTLDATDILQFAGGTFDSKITVDAYNSSTHAKSDADADDSAANEPNNNKYVASGTGDWGDGTEALNLITDAECTLKINFAHGSDVNFEDAEFYAYDGTTTASPTVGMIVYAAEQGDAAWTRISDGSGTPVTLADGTPAGQTFDRYIAISAAPTSVGAKTGKYRVELTYF